MDKLIDKIILIFMSYDKLVNNKLNVVNILVFLFYFGVICIVTRLLKIAFILNNGYRS